MAIWLKVALLALGILAVGTFVSVLHHVPEEERGLKQLGVFSVLFLAVAWLIFAARG